VGRGGAMLAALPKVRAPTPPGADHSDRGFKRPQPLVLGLHGRTLTSRRSQAEGVPSKRRCASPRTKWRPITKDEPLRRSTPCASSSTRSCTDALKDGRRDCVHALDLARSARPIGRCCAENQPRGTRERSTPGRPGARRGAGGTVALIPQDGGLRGLGRRPAQRGKEGAQSRPSNAQAPAWTGSSKRSSTPRGLHSGMNTGRAGGR